MDERNDNRLAPSLVNGRLEGISLPDLLWAVCRRKSTGVLQLSARGVTKKVYISGGRIIFAASSDPNDRLGEMLLRDGIITLDQLEQAIVKLSSGKRLGTILVEAGHLAPDNLVRGVLSQVRGIVLGLFSWEDGEYAFHEGPLPTEEVVTLTMRTAEILLQGIRQIRSFTRVRRSVGSPTTRFRLEADWKASLEGLEIRDGERMLLQRVDEGREHGVAIERLCREVFLSNYEIYQALLAFKILGIVGEVDRAPEVAASSVLEGRLSRVGVPEILVRLSRDGQTGVLFLARGGIERTFHVKSGVCVFATSNAIDDGLVAHLLRRGVISLRDREETARRLLSNKRVGTILLEMGVIDESDLRATVREQLSEIVFDSFRWEDGDFQFVPGALPTVEDITLNRTVEDLVFAGVRRVTSWTRVRDGCGGINARVVLKAEYLAVLDKMSVGAEEWELISLLRQPRSVAEICRQSVLGDFRSCQILWALRLLGAIGEAPIEASVDALLGLDERPAAAPATAAAKDAPEPTVRPSEAPETPFEVTAHEVDPVVPTRAPEDRPAIQVSQADESAEVISEAWRLAGERRPDDRPAPTPAVFADAPAFELSDRPIAEAPDPTPPSGPIPRFELGEPGTGIEDMRVDMPPAPSGRSFELGEPTSELEDEIESAVDHARGVLGAPVETAPPAPPALPPVREREELDPAPPPVDTVEPPRETPAPDPEPPIVTPLDIDATTRISREDLEAALAPEQPQAAPPPDAFDPPAELDAAIASFNARHIVVFRALRAEVGAGAANFVRSCRSGLGDRLGEMFAGTELRADGTWDPDGLRSAVVAHRISNAVDGMNRLLEQEMALLRVHLGDKRVTQLVEQLAEIA